MHVHSGMDAPFLWAFFEAYHENGVVVGHDRRGRPWGMMTPTKCSCFFRGAQIIGKFLTS